MKLWVLETHLVRVLAYHEVLSTRTLLWYAFLSTTKFSTRNSALVRVLANQELVSTVFIWYAYFRTMKLCVQETVIWNPCFRTTKCWVLGTVILYAYFRTTHWYWWPSRGYTRQCRFGARNQLSPTRYQNTVLHCGTEAPKWWGTKLYYVP